MSKVFADTFLYVALLNRHDMCHTKAAVFVGSLQSEIVTTEWVLAEVADAFAASAVRPRIKTFIEELRANRLVKVIEADSSLFRRGLDLYHARPDKEWSLTDCTSFVVMQELHLNDAATGDRHFEQAGYRALLL